MPMLGTALTPMEQARIISDVAVVTLTDVCTILRATPTPDGAGGVDTNYAPIGTDIPCNIGQQFFSAFVKRDGEKLTTEQPFRAVFAVTQDVDYKDLIVYQGTTFQVIGIEAPRTDNPFILAVLRLLT
jgi:hypothetical protein